MRRLVLVVRVGVAVRLVLLWLVLVNAQKTNIVVAVVVVVVVIPLGIVGVVGEVGSGSCSVMTDHYNYDDEEDVSNQIKQ